MKRIIFLLLLFILFQNNRVFAQIERLIVETYYISDNFDSTDTDGGKKLESGSVTYRIFVDLKPGNKLLKLYGDTNHLIRFTSTKPFYNNVDGESFAKDLKKVTYKYNNVALDTWLTLGQTMKTASGKTNFGILKRQDTDGSFIGGSVNNDGGSAAIPGGLLTNTISQLGIPLTVADGMDTMVTLPTLWGDYGVKDFFSGVDTTMFGFTKVKSEFKSYNFFLKNSGVSGVVADSNQILIAQLTTKGELSFELNLEVLIDGVSDTVRYVANDDTLVLAKKEKKNRYLKYPFPPPVCGCKDANFLEYNPALECANMDSCIRRIVFGCMDPMACNYDPAANFNLKNLCCYPGSCGGRDISAVCPSVNGSSFECEIYPNPAQNSLFFNLVSGSEREISYSIYNFFGTEVVSAQLGPNQRLLNHEIDLSSMSNGLYLIRIKVGNDFISKQFFKN